MSLIGLQLMLSFPTFAPEINSYMSRMKELSYSKSAIYKNKIHFFHAWGACAQI